MEVPVRIPVGSITLEGLYWAPYAAPAIGVVLCHPHPLFGGDMHNNVVDALTDALQAASVATLRFNFRGVGSSEGHHDDGIAEQDDVKAAVSLLQTRTPVETVVVAGYSFGSFVGLQAGAADPRVNKLVGIALPVARRDASFLHAVTKPKLLVSGDRDDISPVRQIEALSERMPEPKALSIISGADHFFRGREGKIADAVLAYLGVACEA